MCYIFKSILKLIIVETTFHKAR